MVKSQEIQRDHTKRNEPLFEQYAHKRRSHSKLLQSGKTDRCSTEEGDQLGLTADELAFYDALTKPQAIKDFYENEELIAITKSWRIRFVRIARLIGRNATPPGAKMRMMIKKLLKKHRYPPEGMDGLVRPL